MLYKKENKIENNAFFTARHFLEHKKICLPIPKNIIMVPIADIEGYLKTVSKKRYRLFGNIDIISDNLAIVSNFGMGAPMAAMMLEVLIELGAQSIVLMGIAGGLDAKLKIAGSVLCSGALCDDGTSRDYINQEDIKPNAKLSAILGTAIHADSEGFTWTTDSIFRETPQEIAFYQAQGIETVEMEAAAIFAICATKNLPAAAAFVISDLLTGTEWQPCFFDKQIKTALIELIKRAVKVLS